MLQLRVRAGCLDFGINLEKTASVQEVKVASTAGCDIDPELMKVIYKGRVLKDEETLDALCIQSGEALHIAKGTAKPGYDPKAVPISDVEIQLKGPGGGDVRVPVRLGDGVADLRKVASSHFEEKDVHLLFKGKMLKDGASLEACGVTAGATVRVARRQVEPRHDPPTAPVPTEVASVSNVMPMAWGETSDLRTALDGLGLPPQQALALLQMAQSRPAESPAEMQARWAREAADMTRQVRGYLERSGEMDEELLTEISSDISRTLAEARGRGAPVPNAAVFVDRAVARMRQAKARQERLDREASGIDPEIEEAFAAAEQSVSAAQRAPRRLGDA